MDGQDQKISQVVEPPQVQPPQTAQQKLKISDAEARALLTINNLQPQNKSKDSKKVRVYVGIVIAIVISILLTLFLHGGAGNGSGGVVPSSNNPLNNGGSINSQVQYCSNPINASLVC